MKISIQNTVLRGTVGGLDVGDSFTLGTNAIYLVTELQAPRPSTTRVVALATGQVIDLEDNRAAYSINEAVVHLEVSVLYSKEG